MQIVILQQFTEARREYRRGDQLSYPDLLSWMRPREEILGLLGLKVRVGVLAVLVDEADLTIEQQVEQIPAVLDALQAASGASHINPASIDPALQVAAMAPLQGSKIAPERSTEMQPLDIVHSELEVRPDGAGTFDVFRTGEKVNETPLTEDQVAEFIKSNA